MNDNITRNDMKYLYTCILNEATSRSELPDEIFGVPEERKYPLDTKEHIYSAVKLFNHVNKKYEEELADNINKKIKEYNITDINPGPTNRFSKYYNQPVKESVPMSSDPMYLYMQNGNYDYLQKWYNNASTYPIKFGLPSFINEDKFNRSIIEAGDKIYHHYWKNRKGFQNKGVGPFVVYGTFTKSKPLKTGMFSPSTTNIDDMVNENVDGFDKISTIVYHYNFSNRDKKYSVLIVTAKNTVKAVYLLSRNERSVENEFIKLDLKSITTESTNIILEAPTDVDVDEDDVNDYSDDVEDDDTSDDESDTEDDTGEEDLDDEPNDYSDDIDSEDDTSNTEDDSDMSDDEVDTQSDEDGESVDDTDSNDSGEEDTTDDSGDESNTDTTDDSDDTGFDDEPNDYSDSVDGDGSGDDSDTTDDDTSTDDSDGMSDSSDDSMESDDENNTLNNNNIIKNYNLLMDFQKLHTSLEDILTNLKAASYKTSLQNAILRRVLSNVETLKDEVLSYIEYNFGSNYTQNLYYFNTYIQLLKITLEMMKKMGELSQDDK